MRCVAILGSMVLGFFLFATGSVLAADEPIGPEPLAGTDSRELETTSCVTTAGPVASLPMVDSAGRDCEDECHDDYARCVARCADDYSWWWSVCTGFCRAELAFCEVFCDDDISTGGTGFETNII